MTPIRDMPLVEEMTKRFRECSDERLKLVHREHEIIRKLKEERNTLLYDEYVALEKEWHNITKRILDLDIERNTWMAAREVCIDYEYNKRKHKTD